MPVKELFITHRTNVRQPTTLSFLTYLLHIQSISVDPQEAAELRLKTTAVMYTEQIHQLQSSRRTGGHSVMETSNRQNISVLTPT